jgi:hypothetical protein
MQGLLGLLRLLVPTVVASVSEGEGCMAGITAVPHLIRYPLQKRREWINVMRMSVPVRVCGCGCASVWVWVCECVQEDCTLVENTRERCASVCVWAKLCACGLNAYRGTECLQEVLGSAGLRSHLCAFAQCTLCLERKYCIRSMQPDMFQEDDTCRGQN